MLRGVGQPAAACMLVAWALGLFVSAGGRCEAGLLDPAAQALAGAPCVVSPLRENNRPAEPAGPSQAERGREQQREGPAGARAGAGAADDGRAHDLTNLLKGASLPELCVVILIGFVGGCMVLGLIYLALGFVFGQGCMTAFLLLTLLGCAFWTLVFWGQGQWFGVAVVLSSGGLHLVVYGMATKLVGRAK